MERLDDILSVLEDVLVDERKKHIVGGVLLSISLLFGGLALTVATLKTEEK